MIWDIVAWVIFGALAGWIASIMMHTDHRMGMWSNIIVGIIGAFIGGFVVQLFTGVSVEGFNFLSFIVAILGAVILLAIVKLMNRDTPHHAQ